jgi:hypothetical protein
LLWWTLFELQILFISIKAYEIKEKCLLMCQNRVNRHFIPWNVKFGRFSLSNLWNSNLILFSSFAHNLKNL